jgi:hypothetical protein
MKMHRRHNPLSTTNRSYKPLPPTPHRPSQIEIALISFLIVLSLTFFLLAVYVSIRHRRLMGSPRLRGRHWDRDWKWEDNDNAHQRQRKLKKYGRKGDDCEEGNGAEDRYHYHGRNHQGEDKGGGGGDENGRRGSVLKVVSQRVVAVLHEVGRRVSGVMVASSRAGPPQCPVRDVEFGAGSGTYGYGYGHGYGYSYGVNVKIEGQMDGFEAAGREPPVLNGSVAGMAWPRKGYSVGSAACLLRRRGELRLSAESECPV